MKKFFTLLFSCLTIFTFAQNAIQFDGVDDYIQCPLPGPVGASSRTVEAWIKIPGLFTAQKVILDYGDMLIGGRFTFNIINGLPRIEVGGNGLSAPTAISVNIWHHIAATYDNNATTKLKLFVDGLQVAAGNPSVTTSTNVTNGIQIGRRNDATGFFAGYIDEVRVWNIARTQSQISADMSNDFCPPYAGLVAYYNFNQGTASGSNLGLTTLNNLSNNANNGVLNNFTLTGGSSNWVAGKPLTSLNSTLFQSGGTLTAVPANASYQWINCTSGGATIAGATQQLFIPTASGSYAVIISKNGCVDTSACVLMSVSIEEINKQSLVQIYPNPFSSTINLSSAEEIIAVRIIDLKGQLLFTQEKINSKTISLQLDELVSGPYFMEIENKHAVIRQKINKK